MQIRYKVSTITNVGENKESPGSPARVPSLDLAREYAAIGPMLLEAVERVLSSQNFIMGAQVAEFEQAAAVKCGVRHALGCASGTDAIWLALAGAGIGPGQVVVTTAFSFYATVSAILRTGAKAVLADIDPETFNLDPRQVRRLLQGSQANGKRKADHLRNLQLMNQHGPAEWIDDLPDSGREK